MGLCQKALNPKWNVIVLNCFRREGHFAFFELKTFYEVHSQKMKGWVVKMAIQSFLLVFPPSPKISCWEVEDRGSPCEVHPRSNPFGGFCFVCTWEREQGREGGTEGEREICCCCYHIPLASKLYLLYLCMVNIS